MKILTAARGDRPDDTCTALAGEPVFLGMCCTADNPEQDGVPGTCGCGLLFTAVSTKGVTTLAEVVEVDTAPSELHAALTKRLTDAGWSQADDLAADVLADLLDIAADHDTGVRLRRAGEEVTAE